MTPISDWFGGRSRVLFVHAHPDDESITTGGTLAALAEAGREPLLITLTRGEQGEVMPGPMQALTKTHGLAVVRQNELKNALHMLGLERHAFLGVEPARAEGLPATIYEDSGMSWGPDGRATAAAEVSNDALTKVPAIEPLNDLLAGAYLSGAQAIVSYDDGGGYGHPDHVFAHRAARAVAASLELPFWQIVSPEAVAPVTGGPDPGLCEDHDVTDWLERKLAALRCYNTQLRVEAGPEGHTIVHVGGQRHPVGVHEHFMQLSVDAGMM